MLNREHNNFTLEKASDDYALFELSFLHDNFDVFLHRCRNLEIPWTAGQQWRTSAMTALCYLIISTVCAWNSSQLRT